MLVFRALPAPHGPPGLRPELLKGTRRPFTLSPPRVLRCVSRSPPPRPPQTAGLSLNATGVLLPLPGPAFLPETAFLSLCPPGDLFLFKPRSEEGKLTSAASRLLDVCANIIPMKRVSGDVITSSITCGVWCKMKMRSLVQND